MRLSSIPSEALLAAADLALIASASAAVIASKRLRPPVVPDLGSAFAVLERSVQTYLPNLAPGFTWGEAFERLKEVGVQVDWKTMDRRLIEYEASRYGGQGMPKEGTQDILSLALRLRRSTNGKRTAR
ncbi:MAG: hypothetical protein JRN08_07355 [Nitrososphaerota archaeon]|nr:hypothetical protein [Nitrososphaerota archaeon]